MRTRRQKHLHWRKIGIATAALLLSPFVANAILRGIPAMEAAAGRAAIVSAWLMLPEGGKNLLEGHPLEQADDPHDPELPLGEGNNQLTPPATSSAQESSGAPAVTTAAVDPSLMEPGNRDGTILYEHFGAQTGNNHINLAGGGQVRNATSVTNAVLIEESAKRPEFSIEIGTDAPQVLVMHTHTTESFEPYERDYFDNAFASRTTDESRNISTVGRIITEKLNAAGIKTLHDTTLHDYPSYNGSYVRSAVTVAAILEQYPSIKVVLDVHRDAIERSSGTVRVAPYAEINGKKAAQVMIISGCDDGTMNMPNYLQNFRLASLLQQRMESDNPGLTRPILFDYRRYNQNMTTGSLLIEVGGHANSFDQAVYTGELIGDSITAALTTLQK